MRVFELADDLKVPTEDLLALLRAMGVAVADEDTEVDDADAARVLTRVERERRTKKKDAAGAVQAAIEESSAPTRRRRRRSAEDDVVEVASEPEVAPSSVEEEAVPVAEVEPEPQPQSVAPPEPPAPASEAPASEEERFVPKRVVRAPKSPEPETPPVPDSAVETTESDDEPASAPEGSTLPTPAAESAEDEGEESRPRRRLKLPDMAESGAPAAELASVRKAKPEPVASYAPPVRLTPAASAGPGGQVRIQADGFTADGKKKAKKKGKKKGKVDIDVVQDNVTRVMAELKGGGKKKRKKGAGPTREEKEAFEEEVRQQRETEAKTVRVNEFLTVAELSELIDIPSTELVGAAFKNLGLMVTINQRLDFDQIELLLDEFNFIAVREEGYSGETEEEAEEEEDPSVTIPRPPVVTVMGHVDHGKTLLLDSIRKTNVVAGESGGITQHIGAYHVELEDGRTISFLDTPGHAAFTAMRARGADVTDIVVLVVAADDSIMPQTVEAISHAKNAGVPIVVAVNKIDLPAANPTKVRQELLQYGVTVEDFGGDVLIVEVSAKVGLGIDDLLEKILLQAEILELRANPDRPAQATVIESKLDVGKGPVVTVLVQRGTLRVGDAFVCGKQAGRVRALLDERGKQVKQVTPGLPVQILGSAGVPQAGDTLQVMDADRAAEIALTRQRLDREKQLRIREKGVKLGDLAHFMKVGETIVLPIIVKADMDGSVQAVADSLVQLSTPEVKVEIIHRAVGSVNESDVLLAETAGAIVVGFRVRPDTNARILAEQDGVEIRLYEVIYEAVDEITRAMEGMLSPEQREKVLGTAEVRELFKISKVGVIAGCHVTDGIIDRKGKVRLIRGGVTVYTGELDSLKRFKDDVREVREGFECGIAIANYNDLKVGDLIESYTVEEFARTLTGTTSKKG